MFVAGEVKILQVPCETRDIWQRERRRAHAKIGLVAHVTRTKGKVEPWASLSPSFALHSWD